jgi:hypothetical protein
MEHHCKVLATKFHRRTPSGNGVYWVAIQYPDGQTRIVPTVPNSSYTHVLLNAEGQDVLLDLEFDAKGQIKKATVAK